MQSLPGILHGYSGDILLIAGDWSFKGARYEQEAFEEDLLAIRKQFKHVVWINGNHEVDLEHNPKLSRGIAERTNSIYLENESTTIKGIKIWGSPVTPTFGWGWAWNVNRGHDIKQIWDQIPDDVDLIMSHGPAYNHCDVVHNLHGDPEHVGCSDLARRIKEIKPRWHVSGHIHRNPERFGESFDGNTYYYNVSICDDSYKPTNKPVVFEVS